MGDDWMTRRSLLATLGAAGTVGLAGCTGGDEEQLGVTITDQPTENGGSTTTTERPTTPTNDVSGTVKIGVLQTVSGALKYYGQQSLWGFYSGFKYRGGDTLLKEATTGKKTVTVGDVTYELYVRDPGFSADAAQQLATELVTDQGVDLLFGCTSSGSAARVVKTVVKRAGVPIMLGPAASAGLLSNGEICSPNVFRASETTAMDARSGGKYVADQTDVNTVYLFGADYEFGHAVVENYARVLKQQGIEIVGKKFLPRGYSEWEPLLDNAAEAGAEGMVAGFTVATLPQIFTAYITGGYDFRVFGGWATRITNRVIGKTLKRVLGAPLTKEKLSGIKAGPFTTRYHWNQYDNEINDWFVDTYTNAYGVVPDLFTSGTFTAASAFDQAVRESGSTEGQDIAAALHGMTVADTPKGTDGYTFQEYNNQARSAMTVAPGKPTPEKWADTWGAAIMPAEPVARIPGTEVTIPKDSPQMGCSL